MNSRTLGRWLSLALALAWAVQADAAPKRGAEAGGAGGATRDLTGRRQIRTTHAQRKAAATRAGKLGLKALRVAPSRAAEMAAPGTAPHYFGPYGNYANSPLRMSDALVSFAGDGAGAAATAVSDPLTGAILAINVDAAGAGYTTPPTVTITSTTGAGTGAAATAVLDAAGGVASVTVDVAGAGYVMPGLRKFVDSLAGLGPDAANTLGNYIPVAVPDTTTYPGADYYEIALVEFEQRFHSDLPPTRLRGYVQLSTAVVPGAAVPLVSPAGAPILLPSGAQAVGVDRARFLGPTIVATKERPVRILFRNLLPTGEGGNLWIPVDTSVMGAGAGPDAPMETSPQNPMCGQNPKPTYCYTENRATLHLHGGISPWISDGTPHQWTTPAGESTLYPKGVSVSNVPDMPDPGPGAITFFYTNQQSARLLFYHDHAWGITRLNVYAGEAAGYLITDPMEQALVADGTVPAEQIPLVIQDRTFVPSTAQLAVQDPTWDLARWGGFGQLWLPHVYMPAQNPGDTSGVNQFGRWAYGPWFWPPTANISYPEIDNPYFDPACDAAVTWCEPPTVPGTPWNSMGMEAFHDTPVVNGTAYPYMEVDPKTVRFRVLNAANDRFFNLHFYVADATGTEVALKAAEVAAAKEDPAGSFPTPDLALSPAGPSWIQIGTEGGFLPAPVVLPPQPITWVTDPTVFNAGNVDKHSLLLGPAERADVIVDFSAYAGQTLILYNDAPAAFPARDPRYDYYTDNADTTSTGGAPTTPPGYGPNTRTVMQIRVRAAAPAPAFDVAALQNAFKATSLGGRGVFQNSQNPIIVGQGAYNSAYGSTFRTVAPRDGYARISDFALTFNTLLGQGATETLTLPLERKAIQDEMGETFDKDYGRMSGNLGIETVGAQQGAQNFVLYPYVNPATEVVTGIQLPVGEMTVQPISSTTDGTQLWKITHNGVDTHPIHFHLFDVQLVNRVGWDGILRRPEANELGWKDTVRISPLEDTIVALRPVAPKTPFGLPDSFRPLNPAMPIGAAEGFNPVDPDGNPITIVNEVVNLKDEYVWHCHILSHEEMDMMRPIVLEISKVKPAVPVLSRVGTGADVVLQWTDGTPVTDAATTWGDPSAEVGYRVERAPVDARGRVGAYAQVGAALANVVTFTDPGVGAQPVSYRVVAYNAAGDTFSSPIAVNVVIPLPAAPSNVAALVQAGPRVRVTFRDNANNESGFQLERAVDGGAFSLLTTLNARTNVGNVTYYDVAVAPGHTHAYRVRAVNGGGVSDWSPTATVTVPALPAAPSNLTGVATRSGLTDRVTLTWQDNATTETGFTLQRATDAAFTTRLATSNLAANATTVTQTGLLRFRTYYFRIRANNSTVGNSAWSNTWSVTTP